MASINKVSLTNWVSTFITDVESWNVVILSNTSTGSTTIRLNIHDRKWPNEVAELWKWVMLRAWTVIRISQLYAKISAIADGSVDLAINII